MGSFRLAACRRYLHRHFNFTESAVETVLQSLRRSCASELTRQGTSLRIVTTDFRRWTGHFCRPLHVAVQLGLYLHSCNQVFGVQSLRIPKTTDASAG